MKMYLKKITVSFFLCAFAFTVCVRSEKKRSSIFFIADIKGVLVMLWVTNSPYTSEVVGSDSTDTHMYITSVKNRHNHVQLALEVI